MTHEPSKRYARHRVLPEFGDDGQDRLRRASVLLVGAGGLGTPVALYLAAAGIGRLGLIDDDVVDISNLQRQVMFRTGDTGRPKTGVARERLLDLNPEIDVRTHAERFSSENALDIAREYDIVVDGSDNFETKYIINDACVLQGKPDVYGGVLRFEGQTSVFGLADRPCYRCLFPVPPEPGTIIDNASAGVLGAVPGIIGSIQAAETIKLIIGSGTNLAGRLLVMDALAMTFREIDIPKDPSCPVCGDTPTITTPGG